MKCKTEESIRLLLIVLSTIEIALLSHITDGIIVFERVSIPVFYTYKKTIVAEIFQDEDKDEL